MRAPSPVVSFGTTLLVAVCGLVVVAGAPSARAEQSAPDAANAPSSTSQAATPAATPPMPDAAKAPLLAVSTVKLVGGLSLKKLMGATVYNENDQKIGSVDDLILSSGDKAVVAVLQVGGFLGVGGKLVAVSYDHLNIGDKDKVVYPGASKQTLAALPGVD